MNLHLQIRTTGYRKSHSFKRFLVYDQFLNKNCIYLRHTAWLFDTHSEAFTTVKLINISSHMVTIFLCVKRVYEIYMDIYVILTPDPHAMPCFGKAFIFSRYWAFIYSCLLVMRIGFSKVLPGQELSSWRQSREAVKMTKFTQSFRKEKQN